MYLRIFLKVCEGCGVLWFRAENCTDVYCRNCAPRLRSLPQILRPRHPRRRPHHRGGTTARRGVA